MPLLVAWASRLCVRPPGSDDRSALRHGRDAHATETPTTQGESTAPEWPHSHGEAPPQTRRPSQGRLYYLRYALKIGWTIEQIYDLTKIDRWFLAQMKQLVDFEKELIEVGSDYFRRSGTNGTIEALQFKAKEWGYSDVQVAKAWDTTTAEVRKFRLSAMGEAEPVYKLVDTCAGEFEASTPYYYSTYEQPPFHIDGMGYWIWSSTRTESVGPKTKSASPPAPRSSSSAAAPIASGRDRVRLLLRAGRLRLPGDEHRIGDDQLQPETVSTDYDTSDLLFFEPLTHEDVLNVCERLNGGPFKRVAVASCQLPVKARSESALHLATRNWQLATLPAT